MKRAAIATLFVLFATPALGQAPAPAKPKPAAAPAAAKPAPMPAESKPAAAAPAPAESKAAAEPASVRIAAGKPSRAHEDARECLKFTDNAEVIKCAEKFL